MRPSHDVMSVFLFKNMKKYLIIICLFPLLGQAETISESIASLFIKGIEFYSENKTQIDSIYQEIEPIITASPENRKQLIIKTIKEHEKDLLSTVSTLYADTTVVRNSKTTSQGTSNIQSSL